MARSDEEIRKMRVWTRALQTGDSSAIRQIILLLRKEVLSQGYVFCRRNPIMDFDEVESEVMLHLCQTVISLLGKVVNADTLYGYVHTAIYRRLLVLRDKRINDPLNTGIVNEEGTTVGTVLDISVPPEDGGLNLDEYIEHWEMNAEETQVVLYLLHGLSQVSISELMNTTKDHVWYVIKQLRKRIKEIMDEEENY